MANETELILIELRQRQLGDERYPLAMLHDAHERLDAAQRISLLAARGRLQATELHELVAEAVTLIEQPEVFVGEVSDLDAVLGEQRVLLRNVSQEALGIKRMLDEVVEAVDIRHDGGIEVAVGQRPFDVGRLQFHHAGVELRVLIHQLREELRNEVGRYGRQNTHGERSGEGAFLLFHSLFDAARLMQHLLGLLNHRPAIACGHDRLTSTVEDLHAEFGFQLLYHRAERGLRHVAGKGRFGEVAIAVERQYVFQLL